MYSVSVKVMPYNNFIEKPITEMYSEWSFVSHDTDLNRDSLINEKKIYVFIIKFMMVIAINSSIS